MRMRAMQMVEGRLLLCALLLHGMERPRMRSGCLLMTRCRCRCSCCMGAAVTYPRGALALALALALAPERARDEFECHANGYAYG